MTEEEWLACEDPVEMLLVRFPNRQESLRIRFDGERSRLLLWRLADEAMESADESAGKYHDILMAMIGTPGRVFSYKRRCDIIRCMISYQPQIIDSSWLTTTVVSLAQQMYESRDFSLMPILADALQDAGCENTAILDHCRDPKGVHVRGCFVVDLVLGKK
jgi:hypothetical protein